MQPNDRPQLTQDDYEEPVLYMVVNDKSFPVPGLETAFVDYSVFDANTIETNAGTTNVNAGATRVNTGTTSVNTSTTRTYSGTTSVNSGTTRAYSGTTNVYPGTTSVNTGTMNLVSQCICNLVTSSYTVCVCNKMKPVCNCHGHVTKTKKVRTRSTSVRTVGCSCAPVH